MGIQIRLPNITGSSEKEQLLQLKSYLYQLSEELQWAFDNINTSGDSGNGYAANQAPRVFTTSPAGGVNAEATFSAIKSLIIKSSDIVNAYYEEINKRLEGAYVAQSDFGIFAEKTSLDIQANSTSIEQNYKNTQVIILDTKAEINSDIESAVSVAQTDLEGQIVATNGRIDATNENLGTLEDGLNDSNIRIDAVEDNLTTAKAELNVSIQDVSTSLGEVDKLRLAAEAELRGGLQDVGDTLAQMTGIIMEEGGVVTIGTTGTIKSGLLYTNSDGVAVYGLEVGQNIKINETEVYSKIARLTSQGLYFFNPKSYDASLSDEENAVAYISDKKLYIGQAEILTSLKIGKLVDYVIKETGDVVTKWEGGST